MNEDEYQFLLEMKANLKKYIQLIDEQLIDYDLHDDNEIYNFLIKKAIMFRDTLGKVDEQLNQKNRL